MAKLELTTAGQLAKEIEDHKRKDTIHQIPYTMGEHTTRLHSHFMCTATKGQEKVPTTKRPACCPLLPNSYCRTNENSKRRQIISKTLGCVEERCNILNILREILAPASASSRPVVCLINAR